MRALRSLSFVCLIGLLTSASFLVGCSAPRPDKIISPVALPTSTTTSTAMPEFMPTMPTPPSPTPFPTPSAITGQHAYSTTVQTTQAVKINYLLYLPESYGKDPHKQWPLILFLHGRGERGSDLELLKKHPLPKILEQQKDFPFIVVSPQHSLEGEWWGDMVEPLNALLDHIQAQYSVDAQRIYLTGLSMGGFGAWELALRYPERFAAVVPVAGGWIEGSFAIPANLCALKDVPIWVFWGEKDTTVLPYQSAILVNALKACGANVRTSDYADADHEASFLRAYADPRLYQWLAAQTRARPAAVLPTSLPGSREDWPTVAWRKSTPEEQGIDSAKLRAMLEDMQKKKLPMHAVLVIRHGSLVMEAYFHPYQADSRHFLTSATKSIVSALVGIAIDQEYLRGVDQKALDFFPEIKNTDDEKLKQAITLEHLLSMSSGLDWPAKNLDEKLWAEMVRSQDWVKYVLDRPVAAAPGTLFNYNSGGSHLLSAILQKATGMSALEFARQKLFTPLGIFNVSWAADPRGINQGATGLDMTAHDMAKFGYLYLKDGMWNGQQIVPAEWVRTSTQAKVDAAYPGPGKYYGYQWWIEPATGYKASGFGGERIFVIPDQDMVVVFLGEILEGGKQFLPEEYLQNYILPAVSSEQPLPANAAQLALLKDEIKALAEPTPRVLPPLPEMAARVSGKKYALSPNSLGASGFRLHFEAEHASIEVLYPNNAQEFPIGLDEVYRFTPIRQYASPPMVVGLKGVWQASDRFVITFFQEGNTTEARLTFTDRKVELHLVNAAGDQAVHGVLQE